MELDDVRADIRASEVMIEKELQSLLNKYRFSRLSLSVEIDNIFVQGERRRTPVLVRVLIDSSI